MKFKGSSLRGFKYNKNIDWAFKMNVYMLFPAINDMDKRRSSFRNTSRLLYQNSLEFKQLLYIFVFLSFQLLIFSTVLFPFSFAVFVFEC